MEFRSDPIPVQIIAYLAALHAAKVRAHAIRVDAMAEAHFTRRQRYEVHRFMSEWASMAYKRSTLRKKMRSIEQHRKHKVTHVLCQLILRLTFSRVFHKCTDRVIQQGSKVGHMRMRGGQTFGGIQMPPFPTFQFEETWFVSSSGAWTLKIGQIARYLEYFGKMKRVFRDRENPYFLPEPRRRTRSYLLIGEDHWLCPHQSVCNSESCLFLAL